MTGLDTGRSAMGFDTLTALEEVAGGLQAQVTSSATGFSGAHGGYVGALALRALSDVVGDRERRPRTLNLQLLVPIDAGALQLEPRLERRGRSVTVASVRLTNGGESVALARGLFGRSAGGDTRTDVEMPTVPDPEDCRPLFDKPVPQASAGLLVEHRPAAGDLPLSGGRKPEILVWMRLVEDRALDPLALTFLADSIPPAVYPTLTEFVPMPSLEISLQFEPVPVAADDHWVLGVARNRAMAGGYLVEDGELWSADGRLLVHCRQLRRVFDQRAA